ncbi:MAG: hypothetical protein ACRDF1_06320 [bacterium]
MAAEEAPEIKGVLNQAPYEMSFLWFSEVRPVKCHTFTFTFLYALKKPPHLLIGVRDNLAKIPLGKVRESRLVRSPEFARFFISTLGSTSAAFSSPYL